MIQQTFLQKCRPFLYQSQHDQLFLDHYDASVLDLRRYKKITKKAGTNNLDELTIIFFDDKMVSGLD